ncbi:MAG TPA: NAD(P)H-hydrate epimerase [Anaerolineales bacterium]
MNPGTDIPAITTAQMAEVDRIMIETYGIQLVQMMENAGRNLAELARRMLGGQAAGKKIRVFCGAGNNGGGGMVAARHLNNWGAAVQVDLAADPEKLKPIPALQWQILRAMGLVKDLPADLEPLDLAVDALIGYGLSGNPRGRAAEWINRMNHSGSPVLALDTPSGLDTTSGLPGDPCVRATATLTLALPKTGLLRPEARPFVGELFLADISVPPELYRELGLSVAPLFGKDTILRIY